MIINSINEEVMKSIYDNSFPFPDVSDPLYILKRTAVNKGQIAAVVLVRLTCEAILLTNQSLPLVTRAKATKEIMESLAPDTIASGLSDCHVFVKDLRVQKFLEHLGFVKSKGGTPMVIQL